MASKKPKSYDLYAQQYRNKYENALTQAKAIAEQASQDTGEQFTESQINDIARQIARTGSFDLAVPEAESVDTVTEVVSPNKASLEDIRTEGQSQGYFGGLVDALQSSAQRTLGNAAVALPRMARSAEDALIGRDAPVLEIAGQRISPSGGLDTLLSERGKELVEAAEANSAAAKIQYDRLEGSNWIKRNLGQGFLDVGESGASGAASLIGGPLGALPVGDVFMQEYNKAKDAGLSDSEAYQWAGTQAAPESLAFIPAKGVLDKIPGVNRLVTKPIQEGVRRLAERRLAPSIAAAMQTAKAAAGEGLGETATGSMQDLAAMALAGAEASELQKLAQQEAPKTAQEFRDNRYRDWRAGFLMGGTLSAPGNVRSAYRAEAVAQEQDADALSGAGLQGFLGEQQAADERLINGIRLEQERIAEEERAANPEPTIEELSRQREMEEEAAWNQRAKERQAEVQAETREGLRRSYVARVDTARQEVEALQERIENGEVDNATLNAASVANRNLADAEAALANLDQSFAPKQEEVEQVEVEPDVDPEALAREEQAKREQEALAPYNATLLKEMEAERKRKEKAEAKKTTEQKAAERKRQREVARQLLAENPGKDITELAPLLRERLTAPQVTETNAIPEQQATASPTEQVPAPEAAEEAATQEVPVLTGDPKIDEQARRMGIFSLNMANPEVAANNESVDLESFAEKVRNIGRNLSKRNTRESVDTQNLVRTGKLILAPNAESVGRQDDGSVAEYDADTGKMYLYTDTLADGDDVGAMVAALHESTHAGQFNDRDGRDSVLQSIMGKERYDAAQARVRAIARKQIREGKQGPERAAVEAAEAAALDNPDFDGDVEALEVMPYYVGEAARRQAERSGIRSVAREIEGSARKFLRDKLGMDLEVTMRDIDYASRRVAGEIVNTELTPSDTTGRLDMIAGRSATDSDKARREGREYISEADRQPKWEFSDSEAELFSPETDPEGWQQLMGGRILKLEDVLIHPELYRQYPQLRDYNINVSDALAKSGAYGQFDPNKYLLTLNRPMMLASPTSGNDYRIMRNTALHEVQHAIQDIEGFATGSNPEMFMNRAILAAHAKAKKKYADVIAKFELGRAVQKLPPSIKRVWDNEVLGNAVESRDAQAQLFLESGYTEDVADRLIQAYAPIYQKAKSDLIDATRELQEEESRAFEKYKRDAGEVEARNTEYRSRMTEDEIRGTNPEDTMKYSDGNVSKEEMQLNAPFRGRDRNTSASLAMAAQQSSPEAIKERKIPLWFRNLFDSTKGVDREIAAMVEAASSTPAGDYMLAEQTVGNFEKALKALAVTRGTTFSKLNAQIESDLSKLTNQGSMAANKKAFNDVVSKYGEAGKQLMNLRDQIDGLSLDMWNVRAESGNPLTEAEKKSYKALLANLGYYTNRQFAALTGKAGKNFADKVWTDWERSKRPGEIDKEALENAKKVSKALKVIIDDSLRIPSNEDMAKMSADSIRRMYSTWVGPSDGRSLEEMKTALAEARSQIGEDRLNREAEDIAQELLGLRTASRPITEYYRGGKLDKGILQERKHMPEEIRDLLGEITDPSMKMLLTVGKQAEFVARNKLLLDLTKQVGQDIQPPNATGTEAVKGMEVLQGDLWGPLEGYYVSPNMKALISDMLQTVATFEQATALAATKPSVLNDKVVTEALGLWGRLAGRTKALTIIGNPMNYGWNYFGAYGSLMLNGNFSPKSVAAGHNAMKELIQYAGNSTKVGAEAMRMNKLGLTDSAFIGDIKSGQYKSLEKLIKEMSGENISMTSARAKLAHLKTVGVETYAMMDVWAKMANFYQQVDFLTDFYKKNGDTKTAEEIDREAADIVNRTNITYKRAAPIVKALEKGGVTHYGTYFYEVFRTQVNNLRQGFDEYQRARTAKTPEARNAMKLQAAKRVGGQLMFWGMAGYASRMLSAIAFGDDEDEAQKLRKLLPEYLQDQDFTQVGTDANGQPVMMNISRVDPIGPATDFMRMMLNTEMTTEELGKKFLDLYVAPRLGGQLFNALAATFGDKRISRNPSTQEWMPTAYGEVLGVTDMVPGVDDNTTRGWTNVLEMFVLPGGTNALRETNPKVEDGTANEAFFGAMRFAGLTLAKLDPQKAARFSTMDYTDTLKSSRTTVANLFRDRPNVSQSEALSKISELAADEHKAYKKVSDVYQGMLAAGLSQAEAVAILKEERLPVEAIRGVVNDTYSSQVISKKSIDSFAANEMKGKTLAQKKEIKDKWNEVWETLSQVDKQMKEKN